MAAPSSSQKGSVPVRPPKPHHSHRVRRVLLFALLTIGLIVVQDTVTILRKRGETLEDAHRQRTSEARLAAAVVEERLHRLSELADSLSTRVAFSNNVADGKWEEAIQVMHAVPNDFGDVDRVFITDTRGVLRADVPALQNVRGNDFSHRGWYQAVSKEWKTSVSGAYARTADPAINVIAVAAPIRRPGSSEVVGILVLQVPLHRVGMWSSEFDFGPGSRVTVVDATGQEVSGEASGPSMIEDLSLDPMAQRAISAEFGSEVVDGPGDAGPEVTAFAGVRDYGWGVIIRQPVAEALASERREMRDDLATAAVFLALFIPLCTSMVLSARRYDAARLTMRLVLGSAGKAMVVTDKVGAVTSWNAEMEALTGITEAAAKGGMLIKLLLPTRASDGADAGGFIRDVLKNGSVRHMNDHLLLANKGGDAVTVTAEACPMTDDDGHVIGAVVIFHGAQEQKK